MQYSKMIDLLKQAKAAGETETGWVNEQLNEAFVTWLNDQHLSQVTHEEEQALCRAFEQGFGICMH